MISLYKVSLNGNYNIFVRDLNFEFTPSKPTKTFSDEEFESSNDIKPFIGDYLVVEKGAKTTKATVSETKKVSEDVKEIPVAKEVEETVINATNASKTSSADEKSSNEKTLLEEKKGDKDDTIVDATDVAKTASKSEAKTSKKDAEVVKADGASKKSAKIDKVETKVEVKASNPVENKPAKKAGRPKKNK